jgi:uncharacterized protein (DUF697 family)
VTRKPNEPGTSADGKDDGAGKTADTDAKDTTMSKDTDKTARSTAADGTTGAQASEAAAGATDTAEATEVADLLHLQADRLIDRHMLAAAGVGLVPIPVVDLIGVGGIQLNMLRRLSDLYDVPFSANVGKNILAALVGGAIPAYGALPMYYLVRNLPIVGWTLGAGAASILAGGSTYAVGHVLERHFAKGGTLDDLNVEEARSSFKDLMARGKERAANLRRKKGSDEAARAAEDVAAEAKGSGGTGAASAA